MKLNIFVSEQLSIVLSRLKKSHILRYPISLGLLNNISYQRKVNTIFCHEIVLSTKLPLKVRLSKYINLMPHLPPPAVILDRLYLGN